MTERLQKLLSQRGVASRREAEELIRAGRVAVNGVPAALGEKADPEMDRITLDGRPLPPPPGRVYILLNKPKGYVTTLSDELGRKNAAQLVSGCGERVYPVGRLDMDSEGLLLFTNDGREGLPGLGHRLHRPISGPAAPAGGAGRPGHPAPGGRAALDRRGQGGADGRHT